jgi:GH15 family glucan-1,4-alpha-glucosidase
MPDLVNRSIDIIVENQSDSGAYIASPNFKAYGYSWIRDGSYIAVAMNTVGEHESAQAFHRWVDRVVRRYRYKISDIQKALEVGKPLEDGDFLFTRYSLAGYEDLTDESWGNFQYDGYGTWLWALREYYRMTSDQQLVAEVWGSVRDVLDYLGLVWQIPSYDCWEEHPELLHPYSLACIYGGMQAALALAESCDLPVNENVISDKAKKIQTFTLENGICEGVLVKHIHPDPQQNPYCASNIDSSLLGAIFPFKLIPIDSKLGRATLEEIRVNLLSRSGGLHRYAKDTYYGGGTWVLLTAWLGWIEAKAGDLQNAQSRLDWITEKANGQGWLPEQLLEEVLFPDMADPWIRKWGQVANPLLWSHAMYLIMSDALKSKKD